MPRIRASSARADVGGIRFRDSERSNVVHSLAANFVGVTEQQSEGQSARTFRCGMTGCVPPQELLPSQVSHDVRDAVIVGLEEEHNWLT